MSNTNKKASGIIDTKKIMTPKEVAEKSGNTANWVRYCIKTKNLECIAIGNRYYITPEQYGKWLKNRRKTGRPRKKENE